MPNLFSVAKGLFKQAVSGEPHLASMKYYTMQRRLGKGRFSEVYLAQHNKIKDFIPLKWLRILLLEYFNNKTLAD